MYPESGGIAGPRGRVISSGREASYRSLYSNGMNTVGGFIMSIFQNENLRLDVLSPSVQNLILSASENAIAARASKVGNTHFLMALLHGMDEDQELALQSGLKPGVQIHHVEEILRTYTQPRPGTPASRFTGTLPDFSSCAQKSLKLLDATVTEPAEGSAPIPPDQLSVLHVWVAVLANPEPDDLENLNEALDFEKASNAFQKLLAEESKVLVP